MRRTLASLLLIALLGALMAPLAQAEPDAAQADPDAWPYLVRATQRTREGRLSLDLARNAKSAQQRRQHARAAVAKFGQATDEATMGLQVADKTLKDGLFDAWNEAKKLAAQAKPMAGAAKALAGAAKAKEAKKKAKKARPDDDEPQAGSGSYGVVACARINARRRAIGAPPLCRRGLTRR